MPTIVTRGAASARAFGFGASSANPTYAYKWIFCYACSSSKTFVLPSCVTSVYLEAIGPGGGTVGTSTSTGGGGGGAYAASLVTVSGGATITFKPGINGTCSWASKSGGSPGGSNCGVLANGGAGNIGYTGGSGGSGSSSIGQIKYSGGNGGNGVSSASPASGGGGGSGGPSGNGANGGNGLASGGSGGGGAANGGTAGLNGTACYGGCGGYRGSTTPAQGASTVQTAGNATNGGGGGGGYKTNLRSGGKGSVFCYWGAATGPSGGAGGATNTVRYACCTYGAGQSGTNLSAGSFAGRPVVAASFNMTSAPTNFMLSLGNPASNLRLAYNVIAGVDSSNNVYSVGYSDASQVIPVIVKTSSTGTVLWSRQLPPTGATGVMAVNAICDASFNTYLVYTYVFSGSYKLLVAKYNSSGVIQWQRIYSGGGDTQYYQISLAFDSTGDLWIAGISANQYVTVTVISSSGVFVKTRISSSFGGFSVFENATIFAGESGYMYISVQGYTFYYCCCTEIDQAYDTLSKMTTSFAQVWTLASLNKNYTTGLQVFGGGLDSSNNVYWGLHAANFTPTVVKLSGSNGNLIWSRTITNYTVDYGYNYTFPNKVLFVTSSGNVYNSFSTNSAAQSYVIFNLDTNGNYTYVSGVKPYSAAYRLSKTYDGGIHSAYLTNNNYFVSSRGSQIYNIAAFPTASATGGQLSVGNYGPLNITSTSISTSNTNMTTSGTFGGWSTQGDTSSSGTFTDSDAGITGFTGPI